MRGQGLPVNMIVLTALALLVLVVVGAFFISGFGQASGSINVVDASQADCQSLCQGLATAAFNYNECADLEANHQFTNTDGDGYADMCDDYGACRVTIRGGVSCSCDPTTGLCTES